MVASLDMAHSEIRTLVTKAARGAGLPWGLAEEAGWAADWLSRRALPAADWAAAWLAACCEGRGDPVTFGAALADSLPSGIAAGSTVAIPDGLAGPGYLLPFLHRVAGTFGSVGITDPSGIVVSVEASGHVMFGPAWRDTSRSWEIGPARPLRQWADRAIAAASVIDCLDGLALRTTVPPSAASRNNAGAGTSDND
ncbi:DUF3726 domain-containing protein [Paragemmobacter ruber]|uniref:DUF3726 domain-containing protein n=1 Tax=Paragemmobacter ruber TaxID=1985673 RepID=A0ABW9YAM5_9RHOB|nr:DUF3726 domain-containing protein [Rhodobacter ruber]NBE09071.1 DUF3726 domain-containing protein [Rhodobacter ruber]